MSTQHSTELSSRAIMAIVGGLAGGSMWLLFDVIHDLIENGHVFLLLASFVCGFFAVLLALMGPAPERRAAGAAAVVSGVAALMLAWVSLRHADIETTFDTAFAPMAWSWLIFIATPFAATWLQDRKSCFDYALLFDISWTIVVRYAAAWLFVGVFWGVVFLSNALLGIVGITIIEDLLDVDPVPYVLSGISLGLAMAVVHELRDYISAFLILRLLRLLIPVVLVVVGVFIVAIPFRGLSGLFGEFSAAGTLMAMAWGVITLISTALDRDDEAAVQLGWMRAATQALALLLPVMAVLAHWAVVLRVQQYGWTPHRLGAFVAALFILGYAMFYAVAICRRQGWAARIRRANIVMATGMAGICILWMSPVLNAERISSNSQVARYISGTSKVKNVPAWEMAHEWGYAGQDALDTLRAIESDQQDALLKRIEQAENASTRYVFNNGLNADGDVFSTEDFLANVTILPSDYTLSEEVFQPYAFYHWDTWVPNCATAPAPGCVLILGDFDAQTQGHEGIFFGVNKGVGHFFGQRIRLVEGKMNVGQRLMNEQNEYRKFSATQVQQLVDEDYRIAPSSQKSIWIGDIEINPNN